MMLETGDELIVDFKLKPEFKPVEPVDEIALGPVYFERGADFVAYHNEGLNATVRYLTVNPDVNVELRGHTDSVGDEEMNYHLFFFEREAIGVLNL